MEHTPKPLLRRLVLTFLVGAGCFFTGLVFFLHQKDISFFILSILLSVGSAAKAILLGLQIRRKSYTVLEGTCTDVRLKLGNEHLLRIGKDYKVRPGLSYRFYFRTSESIPSGQPPLLAIAALTDNLLGVEELK